MLEERLGKDDRDERDQSLLETYEFRYASRRGKALDALRRNTQTFDVGGKEYTFTAPTPQQGHYGGIVFLWDNLLVAQVCASAGANDADLELASSNLQAVLDGMSHEGALYNMFFLSDKPGNLGIRSERETFKTTLDPEARTSKYLQPQLQAETALSVFQGWERQGEQDKARELLKKWYPTLKKSYDYLRVHRRSDNGLYFLIHPHATGRDSSPEFALDGVLKGGRLKYENSTVRKILQKAGLERVDLGLYSLMDYRGVQKLGSRLADTGWDLAECKEICNLEDIMFNVLLARNLHSMETISTILGEKEDAKSFAWSAKDLEASIQENFWDGVKGMYLSRLQDTPLKTISVGNLFPLMLESTPATRVEKLLDLIENPDWFGTDFPLPSVPKNSPHYDPNFHTIGRIWLGPTWINTNYFLARGLVTQADRFKESNSRLSERCKESAMRICLSSAELVEEKYAEFYHPENGDPQRDRVVNFAWSTLGELLGRMAVAIEKDEDPAEFTGIPR